MALRSPNALHPVSVDDGRSEKRKGTYTEWASLGTGDMGRDRVSGARGGPVLAMST